MIECNQIAQVALELKMKFDACKVLEASDLDRLVELVEAVNNCSSTGGTTINASQIVYDNSVTGSVNTNIQNVIDEIYNLTNIEQDNKVRVIDISVNVFNDLNTNKIPEILNSFNSLSETIRTVDEDEIILIKAEITFQENAPFEELYILKTGKGIQNDILATDIELINKSREISFISVNGTDNKTFTLGFVDGTNLTANWTDEVSTTGSGIENLVEDTTPQLGGDLDLNGNDIPVSPTQQTALDNKQDTLISGTNIKTINGESLLGSTDISISSVTAGIGVLDDTLYHNGTDFVKATPVIEKFTGLTGNTITLANTPLTTNEFYFDLVVNIPRIEGAGDDYTISGNIITTNFTLQASDVIRIKYLIA